MKNVFIALMIISFCSCSKEDENNEVVAVENNETVTVENMPNIKEFSRIADAFDNIDIESKVPAKNQMANYLDEKYPGNFKDKFNLVQKTINSKEDLANGETIDLDKQLEALNFSELQTEYLNKILALYSDDEETTSITKSLVIDEIKSSLLIIRDEIKADSKLKNEEKEQMYMFIDVQYATVFSVFKYVERVAQVTNISARWFSFRKMINQVVTIVVGVVVGAVLGTPGGLAGQIAGGIALGGIVSYEVFHDNICIKICGTGSCNTSFFSCK